MDFISYINFFVTLLVICNPIGALPAILKLTQQESDAERKKTALIATLSIGIILLIVTWIGSPFLHILGLKVQAFQVAGGFVVFLLALSMLRAEESPIKHSKAETTEGIQKDSIAVTPLAMPVIAGPGAISTIIVQTNLDPSLFHLLVITIISVIVTVTMGFILYFSSNLRKALGHSGINIFMRIGGLILATNAIETMAAGIKGLFS